MQARLDTQIAEPTIERQRITFHLAAARVYWAWVAAGQRKRFADELVQLAEERDEQLRVRVLQGATANVERIDNQQNMALRYGLQVQARRAFQQATIELSLFLRDETGRPTLAGVDRLPPDFPKVESIDPAAFDRALQTAFQMRPEPRRLRLLREKAIVDLRLAQNQVLPTLNAGLGGSQDAGFGKSSLTGPNGLDRSNLNASLLFALPVQRREARGRVLQAQALVNQLDQQIRQAEDEIRAQVQDAFSALDAAAEFYFQARARVDLAATVARAEREQLKLGRSNVLTVTLREQATFDAEIIEVGAQQEYFRALAEWRAALGLVGTVPAPVEPGKSEEAPTPRPARRP
jgi:outer membrane protein TolC